jgi:hypothetical protein
MKQTRLDFNAYVILACKYAYLEYEFGINSPAALFYLNQKTVDYLKECWISCVPIPNAANFVAQMIKKED